MMSPPPPPLRRRVDRVSRPLWGLLQLQCQPDWSLFLLHTVNQCKRDPICGEESVPCYRQISYEVYYNITGAKLKLFLKAKGFVFFLYLFSIICHPLIPIQSSLLSINSCKNFRKAYFVSTVLQT